MAPLLDFVLIGGHLWVKSIAIQLAFANRGIDAPSSGQPRRARVTFER
jgi:hypothetical protein